jgi:hypothetical protein
MLSIEELGRSEESVLRYDTSCIFRIGLYADAQREFLSMAIPARNVTMKVKVCPTRPKEMKTNSTLGTDFLSPLLVLLSSGVQIQDSKILLYVVLHSVLHQQGTDNTIHAIFQIESISEQAR